MTLPSRSAGYRLRSAGAQRSWGSRMSGREAARGRAGSRRAGVAEVQNARKTSETSFRALGPGGDLLLGLESSCAAAMADESSRRVDALADRLRDESTLRESRVLDVSEVCCVCARNEAAELLKALESAQQRDRDRLRARSEDPVATVRAQHEADIASGRISPPLDDPDDPSREISETRDKLRQAALAQGCTLEGSTLRLPSAEVRNLPTDLADPGSLDHLLRRQHRPVRAPERNAADRAGTDKAAGRLWAGVSSAVRSDRQRRVRLQVERLARTMGEYATLGALVSPVARVKLLRQALEAAFVDDEAAVAGVEDAHLLGLFTGVFVRDWISASSTDQQALVLAGIARLASRMHDSLQASERWSRRLGRRAIVLPIFNRDVGAKLVVPGQLYAEVKGPACPPSAVPLPDDFVEAMTWIDGPLDGSERAVIFVTPTGVDAQGEFREVRRS